jgi:hypothetical protein
MARNLNLSVPAMLVNMLANAVRGGERINAIDMMANLHLVQDDMAEFGFSAEFWKAAAAAYTHRLPKRPRGTYAALRMALNACPEWQQWSKPSPHGRLVNADGIIIAPMSAQG